MWFQSPWAQGTWLSPTYKANAQTTSWVRRVSGKTSHFHHLCQEDKATNWVTGLLKHSFGNNCGKFWSFTFPDMGGGEGRGRGKKWGWGGESEEERRGESWTKHTSLSNFMGYLPSIGKHWISIVYSMFNSLLCPFCFALPPSCCLNLAAPWILSPRPPWWCQGEWWPERCLGPWKLCSHV